MLTVSTMLNGAFAVVRARIAAIGVWALIYFALTIGLFFAMRPWMADMVAMQQVTPGTPPDMSQFFTIMGRLTAINVAMAVVLLVLYTAALRAALRPQDSAFAYLRLGADELRMLGLGIILCVAFFALYVALVVAAALLGVVLSMIARDAMIPVFVVLILAVFAALVYFQVRLSLAFALTMLRGRIVIGESWRLTRGRFWTLFGGFLVLGLMLFAAYMVVFAINAGPYLAELGKVGTDPVALRALQRAQLERQLGPVSPLTALGWVLAALLGAFGLALWAGAVGSATLALLDEDADFAEVGAGRA